MKIQEEFARELIPGETYYFNYKNKTVSGKFKRATKAWKIFEDESGNEMHISPWSNVATTPEDIEGVERAVDAMEKDIKLPSRVPNRETKAPNRHGFVESTLREGIYDYQTFTKNRGGKPVYTLTYGSADGVIAKYDKGSFEVTFSRDWKNHIEKIISWLKEYYPGFFTKEQDEGSGFFIRFNPSKEEAIEYIEDYIKRGKVVVESSYKSGDRYYGGLPSDSDYKGPGKDATYYKELVKYFRDTVEEYPEYKVIGSSPITVVLRTPDGKETIDLRKFDSCSSSEEAIEMASHYFDDSLFEANELEKRAKKHKKKSKGMSMFGLNPNAGNVEINNKVFNAMNNVTNSPSTNPTGPMGEEMSKLEALSVLSRLNEDESVNERDFAIYCDNSFGKYKVANWKAVDAETAVAEFKELNPRYAKTGLITAVEI